MRGGARLLKKEIRLLKKGNTAIKKGDTYSDYYFSNSAIK